MMWRHVFDSKIWGGNCKNTIRMAREAGYTMFAFNGKVFAVHTESDPLMYPLFPITEIGDYK